MTFKWDENSTLIFLNAYQKHPCLWNPHHVKYYDCLAKNEALRNIIKELNIPGLNISNCLEQIKIIREKYGKEQIRVIKGFHLQKLYKSSFAWFSVISDMLTKVINDESKLQKGMRSAGTISPSILKDCVTIPYDKYKDISNFPCAQETRRDHKTKPRKNTKFTKTGNADILDDQSEKKNNTQLLQCPSCGWEDIKPEKLNITAKKTYEQIKPSNIAVLCPGYTNSVSKPYEGYKIHRQIDDIYRERYNNVVPCPSFPRNLPDYAGYPTNVLETHTYHPRSIRDYINQQATREAVVTTKPRSCTKETQLSSEQFFPEKRTKQVGTSVEHRDKGIQNTICVSKTNISLPPSKSTYVETNIVRKCHREAQNKPLISQEELKQIAVNTVERCDKKIQNTICVSHVDLNDCQNSKKYSSTLEESKQVDTSTVECPANDMQNIIGIKLKTVECSMPNIILVTIDGNYIPLIQRDFKSMQLASDKCQRDIGDLCQDRKEAEKARLELDGRKFVENEVCVKGTCSRDAMEIIKHDSAITQALLQCLRKISPLREETKTPSVTSLLSKKDDSSEGTICEPCKFANKSFVTSSAIELESPNCLPCLEETKKDNVIITFAKIFLELMKHALVLNSKRCAEKNAREGCIRKEDAIDTLITLNKIKECADKILKIYAVADCSKKQLSNKSCPKYKSKCPPKIDLTLSLIQTQALENGTDQFAASYANSKDVEVLYGPSASKIRDNSLSENYTTFVETTTEKKFSVKDKEITARSENHDIGLSMSLPQASLRDSGTQYTPKQLQNTGVMTEHGQNSEETMSVGTQNREPILIRVVKRNNSEGILKLDKETCVRDAHIETYPVLLPPLSKNMYRKYLIREYYNELMRPGVSHIREKEVNCIDYHASLLSNKNHRYKSCKNSLSCNRNWTKANSPTLRLLSNRYISRIPLYAGSHKYARRRTDLYKMSQLYL